MTETEFLSRLRALPLHPGAHGLSDDTATLGGYTITTDTLVEGVHYLATDPPEDVAWKLLATNLSDLAAKGAVPVGVLLNYPLRAPQPQDHSPAWKGGVGGGSAHEGTSGQPHANPCRHPGLVPGSTPPHIRRPVHVPPGGPRNKSGVTTEAIGWDAAFLAGLSTALTYFATSLLGGDTVSLPAHAPRVITLTAIGQDAPVLLRSGAQAGDALYVTGTIGNAGAGLAIAQGKSGPAEFLAAYRRPQPRLAEGRALAPHVHAMMDVSDGLLIDAQRMAAASGLAVEIDLAAIPLSSAYPGTELEAATAGDDYELLFAAPEDFATSIPITRIGRFALGTGLTLTDNGVSVPLPPRLGYTHDV